MLKENSEFLFLLMAQTCLAIYSLHTSKLLQCYGRQYAAGGLFEGPEPVFTLPLSQFRTARCSVLSTTESLEPGLLHGLLTSYVKFCHLFLMLVNIRSMMTAHTHCTDQLQLVRHYPKSIYFRIKCFIYCNIVALKYNRFSLIK